MLFGYVLQSVFEIVVAGFIIYRLFFEERFAKTERQVVSYIKKLLSSPFSSRIKPF